MPDYTTIRVPKAAYAGFSLIANYWKATRGPTTNLEVAESLLVSAFQEFMQNEQDMPQQTRERLGRILQELTSTTTTENQT